MMECEHCRRSFDDPSVFETHCKWHSERQAQLRRPKQRQYRSTVHSEAEAPTSPTVSSFSASSNRPSDRASLASTDFTENSNHLDVTLGPAFQVPNVEVTTPNDVTFGSLRGRERVGIHTVEDILKTFPEYSEDQSRHGKGHARELECQDCHAAFFSQADCDYHQQTSLCQDSAAVAYVMISDAAQPGGYRVERRLLPFDVSHSRIKCPKCKQSFATQEGLDRHQTSHVAQHLECVHCQSLFHTVTELESHYDWHDDMEFRHHRNKIRAKQPGLKLLSELGYRDQTKVAVPTFRRQSMLPGVARPMPVIHEASSAINTDLGDQNSNDDFVAISFISAEDLERTHAPNGIFRDPNSEDLRPSTTESESSTPHSAEQISLRPPSSEISSQRSINSLDMKLEANLRPDSPGKRAASIRNLFRKTMIPTPPQSLSGIAQTSAALANHATGPTGTHFPSRPQTQHGHKQQDSNGSNTTGSDFQLLGAILRCINESASRKDLNAVKRESDEFLDKPSSHFRMPKQHHVRIQALSSPEGVIVTDVRGITRVLNDHAKDELTSGIKNMPALSWARAKVRILSIRADLSSEQEDFSDALWCYEQLLEFVMKFPAIFPGEIWHAAILANLADLAEKLNNAPEAEAYYLRALEASYSRRGRYDNDNVKLLEALAELCKNTGHLQGAAELFSRVVRRREETVGPEAKETLVTMQDLAAVHAKLRNLHVARNLYERSLEGLEAISSLDDQIMLSIMNALCDIYVQLNHMDEANALALRALPAMRLVLGPDHSLTRATLSHYLEYAVNFDFNEHIEALLQDYREHHSDGGLWVLQGLARAYSLAGLQWDAAKTFKMVWEARIVLQGPQEYATLDALQGRCLALEFVDDIDRAMASYTHLLQMSSRTPPGHEARKRINLTRARLASLRTRRNSLEEEKIAWGQQGLGFCATCRQVTNGYCLSCQFFRFCSEGCRDRSGQAHKAACQPSVSLCESKSVSTADSVPARISQLAVETVQTRDIRHRLRTKVYKVAGAFSLSLDPRRFTTFRVKLSSPVDTFLMFEKDADVRYAIVDVTTDFVVADPRASRASVSTVSHVSDAGGMPFKWFTPAEQPVLVVPAGREAYLLIAPGQEMLNAIVAKRQAIRRQDSAHWTGMTIPTFECVAYCQGIVIDKKEWKRFGYLIEVES